MPPHPHRPSLENYGACFRLGVYAALNGHGGPCQARPLTLVAGIGHATLGHVDWGLLVALLLGSIPGIWLGAQLTRKMPDRLVRALLQALRRGAVAATLGWRVASPRPPAPGGGARTAPGGGDPPRCRPP